jgi:CheY-like chemotaxis protein
VSRIQVKLTNLSDEQSKMLSIIRSSSVSLLGLINDILDLSKIDAGKIELKPECVDVKSSTLDRLNQLKAISSNKEVDIEFNIDHDLPEKVILDKTRFEQVVNNLVGNAIKFTQRGKVSVSYKKMKTIGNRVEIMISVSDTGIGIKEEDIPKLFNYFTQLDNSYSKRFQGTGLGLAISKRLVELMGGEIGVKSEYGKGSTFYFTILVDVPNEEQEVQKINDNSIILQSVHKLNILLVEDDPVSQLIMKQISKLKGWHLKVSSNGREALDICANNDFDLILMDIQMPEMSGFEVTKVIREREKLTGHHIPIIATTAYAMSGDKERCLANGMNDYISKPIDINRLHESIERLTKGEKS